MGRRIWAGLLAGVLAGVPALAAPLSEFGATVTRVVDGDSLWVRLEAGSPPLRLRLAGVDAPEICQPFGAASREALLARLALAGQQVRVRLLGRDSYERWLAQVRTVDGDVAAWLVGQGLAWNDGAFARQEHAARQQRLGVFAQSVPERPRDFRRRHGPCDTRRPSGQ